MFLHSPSLAFAAAVFVSTVIASPLPKTPNLITSNTCDRYVGVPIQDMPHECIYQNFCSNMDSVPTSCTFDKSKNYNDVQSLIGMDPFCVQQVICNHGLAPRADQDVSAQDSSVSLEKSEEELTEDEECNALLANNFDGIPRQCAYQYYNQREGVDRKYAAYYHDFEGNACEMFYKMIQRRPRRCLNDVLSKWDKEYPPPKGPELPPPKQVDECKIAIDTHYGRIPRQCAYTYYNQMKGTNRLYAQEYHDFEGIPCGPINKEIESYPKKCLVKYLNKLDAVHPPPENVVEATENVVEATEDVVEDTENVVEDTENVVEDTENVDAENSENFDAEILENFDAEHPRSENLRESLPSPSRNMTIENNPQVLRSRA